MKDVTKPEADNDIVTAHEVVDELVGRSTFVGHTDEIEFWSVSDGSPDFKVAAYDRGDGRWCGRLYANAIRFFENASTARRWSCHEDAKQLSEKLGLLPERGFRVAYVEVDPSYRKQGVALGLYSAALALAGARHGVLMSDRCFDGGETSRLAVKVWRSRRFQEIAVLGDCGLVAAPKP